MKKNIIIIFLLACLSTAMSAQEEKGNFYIQPKVGFNMAKFVGSGLVYKPKWKVGYEVGAETEWFVSNHNSLSFGLEYRQIGCTFDYKETGSDYNFERTSELERLNMHYIALPIMYNFYNMSMGEWPIRSPGTMATAQMMIYLSTFGTTITFIRPLRRKTISSGLALPYLSVSATTTSSL